MSDEFENQVAEVPASEQVATAAPEAEINAPENDQTNEQQSKTFTQEELDAIVGKRLAREQRKWEREQTQRQAEAQTLRAPASIPSVDQFESTEAYADALAYQKAEQLLAQREQARQQSAIIESYHEREEEARSKYDDFEQVAYNPKLPITDVMAESIRASDIGPEVAYYLGANPKEADRISRLSPIVQAKEIGKIEAKMANDPPVKRTTSAPAPISPVTARSSGGPAYDTTDPRSTKTMTDSQWIEAERARQMKKWQAQANR
jgi:hypothetical protein